MQNFAFSEIVIWPTPFSKPSIFIFRSGAPSLGWSKKGSYISLLSKYNMFKDLAHMDNCMAHQCLPLRRKFMECSIIDTAISLLMKHLVTGQHQKAPNFSTFHWSPHGSLVSIGQHFVTMKVVHLPKRTETSLITESDKSGPNLHRMGPGCA